jgi:hypothetical protein
MTFIVNPTHESLSPIVAGDTARVPTDEEWVHMCNLVAAGTRPSLADRRFPAPATRGAVRMQVTLRW